ncbi:MAG: tRNA lysidine(34) synthetase TilS [Myxococcales bacterium]|nr:tRNA lysidine(34) synthetase TilS [Myxococcales bacterium]
MARVFEQHAPHATRVGVAFSGGPDSSALLLAASRLPLEVIALHVDHQLDPDSGRRAEAAAAIAAHLETPFVRLTAPPLAERRGPEETARILRYAALSEAATTHQLDAVLLAHHRDDQLETVLLRWIAGSSLVGLAGMQPARGIFLRPFLGTPRRTLADALAAAGLTPVDDPNNRDLRVPRNRIRQALLPRLDEPDRSALGQLATRAGALRRRLEPWLGDRLDPRREPDGASVSLHAFAQLPHPLWPFALHQLAVHAGRFVAPRAPVQAELARCLSDQRARLRIDAGEGWRLERHGQRLCLLAQGRETRPFAYTLQVPGVREIPEIEASVGIRPAPPDVLPIDASGRYRGIALPAGAAHQVVVRSRRPGDRFRPLGSSRSLPLRTLLIDWRVRRDLRDRLPLLEIDGELAWIGGHAVADSFRPERGGDWWLIELTPNRHTDSTALPARKGFS